MLMESLSGFVPFITYFAVGYILILSFLFIYSKVTPYCEWSLMQQNNRTAAIAFGGSFLGFTLVIASAAVNSVSLVDFAIWGVIGCVTQLVTFFAVKFYIANLVERISKDELSAGIFLAVASLATGLLNAACMSY